MWLGSSVGTVDEARLAERRGADYIGVGDVFGTRSKSDAGPPLGESGLARIVRSTSLPVIAIGGITVQRIPMVVATGAHGVAVLSPVCLADDPAGATGELALCLERELARVGVVWSPMHDRSSPRR
jgi:thiamine-phosphate diphosphorylase